MIYQNILTLAQTTAPSASAAGNSGGGSNGLFGLVPMICLVVIFYFLIIRPQSQKQKQHQALVSTLKTGDKVVTSGGIHGLISNVKETTVIVKIADNVKVEVDKTSIASVTKRADDAPASAS